MTAPASQASHNNNNNFLAAALITGSFGHVQDWNGGADLEPGEPTVTETGPVTIGATVWYAWTAPGSGPVTFSTCNTGTGGDTTLGAYTGTSVSSLTTVASNNDMGPACTNAVAAPASASQVQFVAAAGTTYYIQVGGYQGATPVDFRLAWHRDPVTANDCKNGGWATYGFANQGLCMQFVNTGIDSR